MELGQLTGVAIGRFVLLGRRRVEALNLDRPDDNRAANGFRDDKVESVIALGEVKMPPRIREQTGDVEFSE